MAAGIEITLDGIAHGGEAIGRHGGKAVFVPYALPGEVVRVEIIEERDRWARARLLGVVSAGPDRVEPPCPYFGPGRCGGCQWQHIAYERQAELKQEIVADQLRRLGHIATPRIADIIALAVDEDADVATPYLQLGYRNQVQFVLTPDGRTAMRRAGSHDAIPVERCLLLHPTLDALHASLDVAWPQLTGLTLRTGVNTGDALVVLEAASGEQPELEVDVPAAFALTTPGGVLPLIGEPTYRERVGEHEYRVSAASFFQVNTAGAEALVELVLVGLEAKASDVVLDVYCGVGLFALPLSKRAAKVCGIESSQSACEDFAANAGESDNLELHEGDAEEVLPALAGQGFRADLVVLDPPRSGAGPEVVRRLAAMAPRRIAYVSCDPATLARDAAHLTSSGYQLVEAQPVDLFPQTYHVETVSLWAPAR
jgi:tRNA/tmRNA/rRNA uracil-C5-methylase (TrmA/RlmC/RlmD family)